MADLKERQRAARDSKTALAYQTGFANHFATEARAGALPVGRNTPQKPPFGLYAEQISGTAFTAPRAENRRTWTYRTRPSVVHRALCPDRQRPPAQCARSTRWKRRPSQLRWSPFPIPQQPTDFVEGIVTVGGNGDAAQQVGIAAHVYAANRR